MNDWSCAFEVCRHLNTRNSDRIEVVGGKLVLTKGTHARTKGVGITSNPKALMDILSPFTSGDRTFSFQNDKASRIKL